MALEPALAAVVGGVVLHQRPGLLPVLGIGLVVLAGIATARAVGDGGTDGATRSGLDRAAGSVPDGLVAA